jgi:organic radical activating enzyme
MNRIPINLEPLIPPKYKVVEWILHNVCNYDCSFCHNDLKSGSMRWKSLEEYKRYTDKLIDACNGSPVWFLIAGGEPTLFPELAELLQYIKSKVAYISLISNGSRTLRWWKELKEYKCLDYLYITCHNEQTHDYEHISQVLNLFHDEQVQTVCMITHTILSINEAISARKYIEENTGTTILFKAMSIKTYDIYSLYNSEQLIEVNKSLTNGVNYLTKVPATFPKEHKMTDLLRLSYDDKSFNIVTPQTLLKTRQNNFLGWQCEVGLNTMHITSDKVYRGVCSVGGLQFTLDDNVKFSDSMIKCTLSQCVCHIDLVTTKIK